MALADPARELEAARAARQLEVGEHHVDLEAGLEDRHRLLGTAGLEDAIAAVPQIVMTSRTSTSSSTTRSWPSLQACRGNACLGAIVPGGVPGRQARPFFAGGLRCSLVAASNGRLK